MLSRTLATAHGAKRRGPTLVVALFALSIVLPAAVTAQDSDDADEIWECAAAINVAQSKGLKLPVSADHVIDHFLKLTGGSKEAEDSADAEVRRFWTQLREQKGQAGLEAYVLETARECSDLYAKASELGQQRVPASQPGRQDLNALGTLSAASLRAYVEQTGDHGGVADYLVYHYPYGKDLFKPNDDGDYLGQLIASVGVTGVRRFSNEAVYAIEHNRYWQYNPPATRVVHEEYRRRLRAQRQTEDEGRRWAERAAADRARKARDANAKPVGSLGRSCEVIYRPAEPGIPGSRIVKCR